MTSVEIPSSVAAALPTLSVFDITNDVSRAIEGSEHDSGLAYVAATSPLAVVRVTERESGFFHDFEAMLSRLVPHDTTERERLIPSPTAGCAWVSGSACCSSASTATPAPTTR
jgi:hypothetical protein